MASRVFRARYSSAPGKHCPVCFNGWLEGDSIVYDDDGRLRHIDCLSKKAPKPKEQVICPDCHMTKPCTCDDV